MINKKYKLQCLTDEDASRMRCLMAACDGVCAIRALNASSEYSMLGKCR
jgi:hypothetical protein